MPFSFKPDSPWATPLPHQTECAAALNDPMVCDQSGIVTLPCGSGKTRIALEQALQCKKVLFLSYELTGVEQFKHALLTHTTVDPKHVMTLTGSSKSNPCKSTCFLSTSYGILTSMDTKADNTQSIVKNVLTSIKWDLIVCDEVHHSPANAYQQVLKTLIENQPSSGKVLGITATLVRKGSACTTDDPHTVFDFIGPVLFEKSWKQMEDAKIVSKLDFVGVSTSMDSVFSLAYQETSGLTQSYVATLPPNKLVDIWNITRLHLLRGHVGIVFCDHIFPAEQVSAMLGEGWFLMRGSMNELPSTDSGSSSTSATNVLTSVEDRMKLKDRINAGDTSVRGVVATHVADAALDIHHANFCYGVSVDASSSEATNRSLEPRVSLHKAPLLGTPRTQTRKWAFCKPSCTALALAASFPGPCWRERANAQNWTFRGYADLVRLNKPTRG